MPGGLLLLEHYGKALLKQFGIATPRGFLVQDEAELGRALAELPADIVLKAQVPTGSRGKSGGIKFAQNREQAIAAFASLMGHSIRGHIVEAVLVEARAPIAQERYVGIGVDGNGVSLLFAPTGGVDVEELVAVDPAGFVSIPIDSLDGPSSAQIREHVVRFGLSQNGLRALEDTFRRLFEMCRKCDALLVEINPLAELPTGSLVALDARVFIDDASLDRQPEIAGMLSSRGRNSVAPSMIARSGDGFRLSVKRNPDGGSVGLIGLGGGLNMTLMDWLTAEGVRIAAMVDIDGSLESGRAPQGFEAAFQEFDRDPQIRSILVNIITCGYRLDDITAQLLAALTKRSKSDAKPVVLHLRGNGMVETPRMLERAGWRNSASMREAVLTAASCAKV